MTKAANLSSPQIVTVFGGSGFLGRHVVAALAKRGYRVRVACRRPDLAWYLQPLGDPGMVVPVQANLRDRESVRHALAGAVAAINLVGILQETGRQKFPVLHAEGPKLIAECADAGTRIVHVSAIGADKASDSVYARTKGEGEEALLKARPDAIIMRPSVIFGKDDSFFNKFAWLVRLMPVLPVPGLDTKFQPISADDVAEAVARAVDGEAKPGGIYELGGPHVRTLREILDFVCAATGRKRRIVGQSGGLARFNAAVMETLDGLTLGLIPDELVITRDQLKLLAKDNVVSQEALAGKRTLEGLGITSPQSYEGIVPSYLVRFRRTGQFDPARRQAFKAGASRS